MIRDADRDITLLLKKWAGGDDSVMDVLFPAVYDDLIRLARKLMSSERNGHTLQSNALIHEGFLRLLRTRDVDWENRTHFFLYFAQMMRHILVDHARCRHRLKRGGIHQDVPVNSSTTVKPDADFRISILDDALRSLAKLDLRKARVVEMKFFGGFKVEEIAEALEISPRTVLSDWKFSKAWLLREVNSGHKNNESKTITAD